MQIDTVEITKLALKPGDILLVRVSEEVAADQDVCETIHNAFAQCMHQAGVSAPILIGPKDIEVSVISAPPEPESRIIRPNA